MQRKRLICLLVSGWLLTLFSISMATENQARLKMVLIRVASSQQLAALRSMPVDIVRVRKAPGQPSAGNSLSKAYLVEAVVSSGMLDKLRRGGFSVLEVKSGEDGRD